MRLGKTIATLEARRLALQEKLDAGKNRVERNRMGQFATPPGLALEILRYAKAHFGETEKVRFLDPAVGTGSFYSALLHVFSAARIESSVGYEIDPHYGIPAAELWRGAGLDVRLEDFTRAIPPNRTGRFNLLICNPPYVRHHHIAPDEKRSIQARTRNACGIAINGLAGLYCYFLGLSHTWMEDGGLAGWLVPSEFMDVNYGASVKRYLLDKATLLHIHRFDPSEVQFGDALVSSAIVWLRKGKPPKNHAVRFTYGGSLEHSRVDRLVQVEALRRDPKWTRYPMSENRTETHVPVLADFFRIKRGLVTGNNKYFVLPAEEIERRGLPQEVFRPLLPSPRYLPENEVAADSDGNPVLDRRLFLLDCKLKETEIRERYPKLWTYLSQGKEQGIPEGYLCQRRTPWYAQENRPPAPFVCTYLGRIGTKNGKPFRFILNHSRATAANVYLMLYPKERLARALRNDPNLKRRIWTFLNDISPATMLNEGRVYGGGLHKLEPKELGNVPATAIANLLPDAAPARRREQGELFGAGVA